MFKKFRARRAERRLHNDESYDCIYWWGDRAGINLRATCQVCTPKVSK